MVYLGVFPTALAFWTWAFALSRTTAGRLAATTYLVPPLSVLLGWLLLSEAPPALSLLGGALCLLGVLVSRRGG
jgi:drug/metabolite transporter (DMT)-like permease